MEIEKFSTDWSQAHIVNDAINNSELTVEEAENFDDFETLIPQIVHTTMFVELPNERLAEMGNISQGEALENLLSQRSDNQQSVLDILVENKISLSIALQDGFDNDPHMINAFKTLNERGITPTFWIVLNDEQGYWTEKANAEKTIEKLERALEWAQENHIDVKRIGLDYEPSIHIMKGIINKNIGKLKSSLIDYSKSSKESFERIGDPEEYMNNKISEIGKKYNVTFETYVGKEPLRTLSRLIGLTMKPSQLSKIIPMVYTSVYPGDDEEKTFNTLRHNETPALGIAGADPYHTPGRDLREQGTEKKPELHLSYEQLLSNFKNIFDKNKYHNPFRIHNVFALDKLQTLEMIIEARKNALK